jgi:cell division protease FtsH
MKNPVQMGLLLLTLTVVGIIGYNIWLRETTPPTRSYTSFLAELERGRVQLVHIKGQVIRGKDTAGREFRTVAPDVGILMPKLQSAKVEISADPAPTVGAGNWALTLLPVLLILGGWFIFSRSQRSGGSGSGNNGIDLVPIIDSKVTFDDVAGIAEAKEELVEIVTFLKEPEHSSRLGGRIPKGVLLQGPPGTGKTLLARAIAGEASVSFFSIGGSDFVEMFAGVGASRVRELFTRAKKYAPCIIFIDEIDAIGGRRSGGNASGSNDEREQTLNALLVEMDGFESNDTVIVIAATNRPDMLDPALLRAGRFDRQITISLPDAKGRRQILGVHAKKITLSSSVDLEAIARSIPGFSGAEIANLVNEAALMAARKDQSGVEMVDFEEAKDKIIMGLARKNVVISEKDRRVTAYHEAGHAIVGLFLEETDPIHKITIMPRGKALGLTQQLPLDERYTYTREYLVNRIKILMGGRIAEELIFGHQTTGASNDIQSATEIAHRIVCEWGMSDKLGFIGYSHEHEGFLGAGTTMTKPYSEQTAETIDAEVKRVIDGCYFEAKKTLQTHNKFLHGMAEVLLTYEAMDSEEIDIVYRRYIKELEMEKNLTLQQGRNVHD